MAEDLANLLRKVVLFKDVPLEDLRAATVDAALRTRRRNEQLFEEGGASGGCLVLMKGRAKVILRNDSGTEIVLGTVEPLELVGELALIDGLTRSASVVATKECQVIALTTRGFARLRENRVFADNLLRHVTAMLRRATTHLRVIHTLSAAERAAWCLARIALRQGQRRADWIAVSPKPSHQQLADMAGCSRETVTRTLLGLQKAKAVTWDGKTYTLRVKAFQKYFDADPGGAASADSSQLL